MEMMPGTIGADYKAPGGKLLRVRMQVVSGTIRELRLTGDFFMHPEEAIETLEQQLIGVAWDAESVRTQVQAFWDTDVQVIGATVEDVVHVIMSAA